MNEYKILSDDHKMDEIKTAEHVKSEDTIVKEIIKLQHKNDELIALCERFKYMIESLESTLYLMAMLAFIIWYFSSH